MPCYKLECVHQSVKHAEATLSINNRGYQTRLWTNKVRYVAIRSSILLLPIITRALEVVIRLRSIQTLASRRVAGWNGEKLFALRHSSKVHFHPSVLISFKKKKKNFSRFH